MKPSTVVVLFAASLVHAHTIFQKISVNGADQGQLKGIRAPNTNNPITNVGDSAMGCNYQSYKDNNIINVPAGARVGAWWAHVIGGPQGQNDPDNPIAASHKGPLIAYMAKVDNAASASTSGLRWFKIHQDGLDGSGKWGVDRLISSGGWHYFDIPQCIAPGNYLLRSEIIALHNAYSAGGAQFYLGCVQINVTGGGSSTGTNTISLPGGYSSNDPGITINIYGTGGVPNNSGKSYPVPGPSVFQCGSSGGGGGGGNPTTTSQPQPTSGGGGGGGTVPLYGQCGGNGYSGPTTCASGTCKATNEWYSQCVP